MADYSLTLAAEGVDMRTSKHPADRPDSARNDPTRRAAYEQAMRIISGRLGICESLSEDDRAAIRSVDAPELLGLPPTARPVTSFLASLPPDVLEAGERGGFADADEFGDPAFLIRR